MAGYVGYAGQGNPATGTVGATRQGTDPGVSMGVQQYGQVSQQDQQLQGLMNLYGPQMALANAQGQQQITGLEGQGYWDQQSLQNQMTSANQNAMFQQAGLGLSQQDLAIQQGALSRQLGNLPAQYGLQTQGFGLQQQQIGLGEQGAQQSAATARRGLDSSATASGSYTSIGANQGRGDISSDLARQMQGFGINRQQLGLQRQGAAMNYMEQTASMQDAQKELGLQSQKLGLSGQEIKSRLDNELNQLGIQSQVSSDQLLSEVSKVQQGIFSPMSGLISLISQRTNLPLYAPSGGQ